MQIKRTNGLWYSAEYSTFSITDEVGKYQLTVAGYSGDAGDALANAQAPNWIANGRMFSTQDNDNDIWPGGSCSGKGGWWYVSNSSSSSSNNGSSTTWWMVVWKVRHERRHQKCAWHLEDGRFYGRCGSQSHSGETHLASQQVDESPHRERCRHCVSYTLELVTVRHSFTFASFKRRLKSEQ